MQKWTVDIGVCWPGITDTGNTLWGYWEIRKYTVEAESQPEAFSAAEALLRASNDAIPEHTWIAGLETME